MYGGQVECPCELQLEQGALFVLEPVGGSEEGAFAPSRIVLRIGRAHGFLQQGVWFIFRPMKPPMRT